MTPAREWREEAISRAHDRRGFDCGEPALNGFLQQHARQSHDSGGAKTWCAVIGVEVLGYYSILPGQVDFDLLPLAERPRGLGRHAIGAFRLARLAVALPWQRRGIGAQLLSHAISRCMRAASDVGGNALLIDAKDDAAARWYAQFGAFSLLDRPHALVLPFGTYADALRQARQPPL